jgi:hypothetical protein
MNNQLITEEAKVIYDRLSDPELRPCVDKKYFKDGIFGSAMRATYGTKEICELVIDPDSKYYADYSLPWSYFAAARYGLDYLEVHHLCFDIDPTFLVPQDFRLGLNDIVYKVDMSIKDATMRNNELYKPSIEHIVPKTMGGPVSDIRNIMILPLAINKALGNMLPETRIVMLHGLTSKSFQDRIFEAESLFLS